MAFLWCAASLLGLLLAGFHAGLRPRDLVKDAGISLGLSLVATPLAVWGKSKGDMDWRMVLWFLPMVLTVTFIVIACTAYRDRLLPRISEGTVLALTLSFAYFLYSAGDPGRVALFYLTPVAALPVLSALTPLRLGRWLRFLLAGWYSFMCLILGFAQAIRFFGQGTVGSSRVDLQACKLEYSIVSPK